MDPRSSTYRSQGLSLHYLEWGDPLAPVLLLVHGARDHARSWDFAVPAFLADGWRVVAPDLRGHGDSDWSPDSAYLPSYHLLDLANLIDYLQAPAVSIIGHSFGGLISARYAAAFPERVRKLVLADGMGPGPAVWQEWDRVGAVARTRAWVERRGELARKAPPVFASVEEGAARLRLGNPHLGAEQALHMAFHGLRRVDGGWTWKSDPLMNIFPPEDFSAETHGVWEALSCPVLIIWGRKSYTAHPESDGRAQRLKQGRTLVYENAGHWLHQEQPEDFLRDSRAFLGQAPAG